MLRSRCGKEQGVVSGALGAINRRNRPREQVAGLLSRRRGGKLQQNVVLDPLLQMANGQQNAFWLAAIGVLSCQQAASASSCWLGLKVSPAKARDPRRSRLWRRLRPLPGQAARGGRGQLCGPSAYVALREVASARLHIHPFQRPHKSEMVTAYEGNASALPVFQSCSFALDSLAFFERTRFHFKVDFRIYLRCAE